MFRQHAAYCICCVLATTLVLEATAEPPNELDQDGYRALFNRKDLTGWKPTFGSGSFQVVDGILRVQSTDRAPNLLYVGKDGTTKFKDFDLIAVSKGKPGSNSGIYIHTTEKARHRQGWLYHGYEIQLNNSKKEKRKTGSLYGIHDLDVSPVDEADWFQLRVRVEGKRIQVWVNDQQTVDYTEPENPQRSPDRAGRILSPDGGFIALQAHDPKSVWYFREIKIRGIQ